MSPETLKEVHGMFSEGLAAVVIMFVFYIAYKFFND